MISVGWADPNENTFVWQFDGAWTLAEYCAAMRRSVVKLTPRERPVNLLVDVRKSAVPAPPKLRPFIEQRFLPQPPYHLVQRVVVIGPSAAWQEVVEALEKTAGPATFPVYIVESSSEAQRLLGAAGV